MSYRRARYRGALAAPEGYDSLVTVGVSSSGPVALWRGTYPRARPTGPSPAALATYAVDASTPSDTPSDVVELDSLPVDHPLVQKLPDGSYLLVGARCELRPSGPEQNALIIAREDGEVVARGCLGDGIAHVQTDDAGTIWVGYFDEGIYGNLGWGERYGPAPLGHAGLVRWSPSFEKLWEFKHERTFIDDCYALNVAPDGVWVSNYSDFPLIGINDGQVRVFATSDVSGPRGVLVDGSHVGIVGRYDDPSAFVVGDLAEERYVETARGHLYMPDGGPMPAGQVHCRDARAHLFVGAHWFSVELDDLA